MTSQLKLAYFDDLAVEHFDEDFDYVENAQSALDAFLAKTKEDRLADSRHVFAYYRDFLGAVGADWAHADMETIPEDPADIWNFVTPSSIALMSGNDEANLGIPFVVLEANCAWEMEHGLLMAWRQGKDLWKVSGYDGHPTHSTSRKQTSDGRIIYDATDNQFTTFA